MSFYHAKPANLPLPGRAKLPYRGRRRRRLEHLKLFEVGHLYTFTQYFAADLPEDLPKDLLLEDHTNGHHRKYNG